MTCHQYGKNILKELKEERVINCKEYDRRKKSLMMHLNCKTTYNRTETFYLKWLIIKYGESIRVHNHKFKVHELREKNSIMLCMNKN